MPWDVHRGHFKGVCVGNVASAAGAGMEFLAVDFDGNIYVNDLSRQRLAKYTQFRP